MDIGTAGSCTSAEEIIRRYARSREGFALSVLEANRPSRAAPAAVSDARRTPYLEFAKTGGSTKPA